MKKIADRAASFIATRRQHGSETAEDYVEIIADLIEQKGEARVCDIAKHVGVSHVTVVKTVRRLKQKGFVEAEPHQSIMLTATGRKLALFCKERHNFLVKFLIALGVPEETAIIDVEGLEHHISAVTLMAFQRHLEKHMAIS